MDKVRIAQMRGMTWNHSRGVDPLQAAASEWRALTGQAIAWAGAPGLPLLLAINFVLYGAYAAWRIVRRPTK